MNNTTQNVALLTIGAGALGTALDLAKSANYIGAGIAVVVGVVAFLVYEKTPTSL